MPSYIPTLDEFLSWSSTVVHNIVYPQNLSISVLLNGTRRWYVSQYFEAPPKDQNYFPHYLETVLIRTAHLLSMLAEHGLYRVFIPVYSWYQSSRNPYAHLYLLKGISALTAHPAMLDVYCRSGYAVRFYGDTAHFPDHMIPALRQPPPFHAGDPQHFVYYGVDGGNPHNYSLQLAHAFSLAHGHAPTWEDMLELYYGDRSLRRLEILIGFSRIYSRGGIPHLLEGGDRIYATVVTPLVISETTLRTILYDYLYNRHHFGRDYSDLSPNEVHRLKRFYEANQNAVIGLMRKYEDLCYPLPGPVWPEEMDDASEPTSETQETHGRSSTY
jgi:hypothetical protein